MGKGGSMALIQKILQGENKTLELKEKLPSGESIAKTVVAFSNSGGGKLVIGVKDNLEMIGLEEDVFLLQDKLVSIIHDSCFPEILPEMYTQNIEGKVVLVIEIPKGTLLPYFLRNKGKSDGTYVRIGATNRKAGPEMISELERVRRNIAFDEELLLDSCFEELNIHPIVKEFDRLDKVLTEEVMCNLKLIKKIGDKRVPTNGLNIILGMHENSQVQCARFKGVTKNVFLDRKEYSNDVFSNLHDIEAFILNHIHLEQRIKGLQREEIPEIPRIAIREALINAIVHRDYSNMGRNVKVAVYDDRIEIISPGAFPNNLLLEDVLLGRSEVRNRVIARVLKELGYIEQWGSGISRIISSCESYGLRKPIIAEMNDYVIIQIFRKVSDSRSDLVSNTPQATPQASEIIQFCREPRSREEIQLHLKLKDREYFRKNFLKPLIEKGILKLTIPHKPKSPKQKYYSE